MSKRLQITDVTPEEASDHLIETMERFGISGEDFCEFLSLTKNEHAQSFDKKPLVSLIQEVWSGLCLGSASSNLDRDDQTIRDEANVLTSVAFRNCGLLEDLHAGTHHPAFDDETVSRISDKEMRAIMIMSSQRLAFLLLLKDEMPTLYAAWIRLQLRMKEPGRWARTDAEASEFVDMESGDPK